MVIQIIRIVLDIRIALDPGIEGDHDQPPPDTVIIGPYLRQMVGIENQRM